MLSPLIEIAPFRDAIQRDHLILTPNHRLAAKITDAWAMATEDSVWLAPRVFSIDHWLKHCWDELQDQNHKLVRGLSVVGAQQSRYYWERAIAKEDAEHSASYAKVAGDTLKTLQNWNLSAEQIPKDTPAVDYFTRWLQHFNDLLKRNRLVTQQRAWQLIEQGFQCGALPQEQQILLYGFQSTPPLQAKIIASASRSVNAAQTVASNGSAFCVQAQDQQQELRLASSWAAQQLQNNPQQRIGIVVPDLNNSLHQVTRLVGEALKTQGTEAVVNISAGSAMADTALVNAALELIGILHHKRSLQEWLQILYSPYSAFDQLNVQFRADAELALRKTRRFDFTLEQFLNAIIPSEESEQRETAILILQPLIELKTFARLKTGSQKSFSGWAEFFNQFLEPMGWPGKRQLNSIEYQQRQHWNGLIEQFCSLDNLAIEVGLATALKHLQQLARESVFHPQTADAPLQILGLLEGAGLRFDQLWIVGMHSQNLPASVSINPLLPAEFQRQHKMPHSLPERELQIAEELLADYRNNAGRLILSYPLMRGEEQLEASPLIRSIPRVKSTQLLQQPQAHPPWLSGSDLCELIEDRAPAYNATTEQIRGGSNLLKNQSICPFNAFAIHRLKAETLEQPSHGLTAMDRGVLLHEILYRLWDQWRTSALLQALSEQQLSEQLTSVIAATLHEWAPNYPVLLGPNYLALEQRRLEKLLGQWLEQERRREAFEIISLESKVSLRFGDLEISMRLDRMDRVGDKRLVIDYKSGTVKPSSWTGDRPADPQLPLYVLSSDPIAHGCAFAQIKGGLIKFVGVSDGQLIPGEKSVEDWPAQVDQWRTALSNLASEFTAGHAIMEVFDKGAFNFQTDLLPLNRWLEEPEISAKLAGKTQP
ncbi:MAG: PD-(D/E)XK nuclease family protein [Porticoccaceae bacterium]|nr:PD-(D/E)XK nuclease family protein [Porticoccaceae bacterium]